MGTIMERYACMSILEKVCAELNTNKHFQATGRARNENRLEKSKEKDEKE